MFAACSLAVGPAYAAPAPTTVSFPYSGAQESWVVPEGVTSITATVAAASGEDYPGGINGQLPTQGGVGGIVTVSLPVTPGTELLILVGQHVAYDDPVGGVVGNRPDGDTAISGGGGSFLATVSDGILVAAGGGGGASRNWLGDQSTGADGGAGGFALSSAPDGMSGGPGDSGGGGATITGPGANAAGEDTSYQLSPAAAAAHVSAGVIIPGYGGGFGLNAEGGGGGGYFGGGAGNENSVDGGLTEVGSGGGGSGFLSPSATVLTTSSNVGMGFITIEYVAPPPAPTLAETGVDTPILFAALVALLLIGFGLVTARRSRVDGTFGAGRGGLDTRAPHATQPTEE